MFNWTGLGGGATGGLPGPYYVQNPQDAARADDFANQTRLLKQQGTQQQQLEQERGQYGAMQQGIANQPAILANQLRQSRWASVFPWLQSEFGGLLKNGFGGGLYHTYGGAGGMPGLGPPITADSVYNPQQIQQQVNATRASNDQSTVGKIQQMQQQTAGRGFGANSPLAQALAAQYQGQNLATNTGAEQQLRFNAAGANAQQALTAQQAREQQFASRQQEDIERNRIRFGTMNALIAALGGLAS